MQNKFSELNEEEVINRSHEKIQIFKTSTTDLSVYPWVKQEVPKQSNTFKKLYTNVH